MRNFLVHGYHHVEPDIVWNVITDDLHSLHKQVVGYLEEIQQNK